MQIKFEFLLWRTYKNLLPRYIKDLTYLGQRFSLTWPVNWIVMDGEKIKRISPMLYIVYIWSCSLATKTWEITYLLKTMILSLVIENTVKLTRTWACKKDSLKAMIWKLYRQIHSFNSIGISILFYFFYTDFYIFFSCCCKYPDIIMAGWCVLSSSWVA